MVSNNQFAATSAAFGQQLEENWKNAAHFYRPSFSRFLSEKIHFLILYQKYECFWLIRWWFIHFGCLKCHCIHHWGYFIENMSPSYQFLPPKTLFLAPFWAFDTNFTPFLMIFTMDNLYFSENSDYQPSESKIYTVRWPHLWLPDFLHRNVR